MHDSMKNLKSATAFAGAALASFFVFVLWRGISIPLAGHFLYAAFAALSAFGSYFTIPWNFLRRIKIWQLRAALSGLVVAIAAHLLLGVLLFVLSGGRLVVGVGLWLFAASWPVTVPAAALTALILEWPKAEWSVVERSEGTET